MGSNDPGEPPLGSAPPQLPPSAARTRPVIFKNKLTWNKVGAVLKKSLVPAELFGEVERGEMKAREGGREGGKGGEAEEQRGGS